MRFRKLTIAAVILGFTLSTLGCGEGGSEDPQANLKKQSNQMLESIKGLAAALESNANEQIIAGHVEGIVASNLDVKNYPEVAKEFLEIYNTKVKGKLKGDAAAQLKVVVDEMNKELK